MPFPAPGFVKDAPDGLFSADDLVRLDQFIKHQVKSIDSKLDSFRTQKLPEYVRLYKGVPKNEEAEFPWPGAANLIIQLIGTFCDELLSRIMAIYMYDPLWKVETSGDTADQDAEDLRKILEKFLMDEAYDPNSLNLYPVEQAFFNSAIKYGVGVLELNWEYVVEKIYKYKAGGASDEQAVTFAFEDVTKHDGPKPRLVPLNKFGFDNSIPNLDDMDLFYTIETLNYWQVEDLKESSALYAGVPDDVLATLLDSPDRTYRSEMQEEVDRALAMNQGDEFKGNHEYDFYKCYIKFRVKGQTYRILAKYNKKIDKVLFSIFNFYPKNVFPVEDCKLSQDGESYLVMGFAQMLKVYQKELSQNNNWRTNNRNFSMMGMLRVDPQSKLSTILQMYPGVMIPAKDGEVEVLKGGTDVATNPADDQLIASFAKERAGIDPSIGGTGGGLVNNKRGIYSASGTSMVLIQQNNRNNLRMSDMRSAHVRIAIQIMDMFATFGLGERLRKYGNKAELLKKALKAYLDGTLGFRLRPTTASNNKELDRQNDILLSGQIERFVTSAAQMIQALGNPELAKNQPALFKWYTDSLTAMTTLNRDIAGNFNHQNTDKLVPKLDIELLMSKIQPQQGPQPQGGAGAQGGQPGGANPQAGSNIGPIPTGGVQAAGGIPT